MENIYDELMSKIPASIYTKDETSDISKLLRLYEFVFNDLKAVIDAMRTLRIIETSEGVILDNIGVILKEDRDRYSDEDYKKNLIAAIFRNSTSGTLGEMIRLVELILKGRNEKYSGKATIEEMYNVTNTRFDGNSFFKGDRFLNSGQGEPAAIRLKIKNGIDENEKPELITYLESIIKEMMPAGVSQEKTEG